jgi:hypothetical protein
MQPEKIKLSLKLVESESKITFHFTKFVTYYVTLSNLEAFDISYSELFVTIFLQSSLVDNVLKPFTAAFALN